MLTPFNGVSFENQKGINTVLTLKVPEKLQLYGLYVYYVVHICDFGMLRVKVFIENQKGANNIYTLYRNSTLLVLSQKVLNRIDAILALKL